MKKVENRGGFRANAKRPQKYGEPTITIAFRVPESKEIEVKELVNKELDKWKLKPNP